jgi:anti-sigma regulatory factor (Ser/Thr protein kinase)
VKSNALTEYAPAWAVPEAGADQVYRLELTTVESSASVARHKASDILDEWRVSAGHIETAQLLITELVSNAVKFGKPPGGPLPAEISLALWLLGGTLIIEVSDQSAGLPVLRPADTESPDGRGLHLVRSLSSQWSYYMPNPGWKTVFCVMDISLSADPGRESPAGPGRPGVPDTAGGRVRHPRH